MMSVVHPVSFLLVCLGYFWFSFLGIVISSVCALLITLRTRNKHVVVILLNLWEPPYGLGFPGVLWAAPQMSGRGN